VPEAAAIADPMLPVPYRVLRKRREIDEIYTLDLEPVDGEIPFRTLPGQFNMVYAYGIGEAAISLSGDCDDAKRIRHTIRRVGAVTAGLCNLVKDDCVGIRGPFGRPWPLEEARGADIVVVAGGIGLAPLRPAIYELLAKRKHYGRIVILYGSRSPDDLLFLDELRRWRGRFDLEVEATVDHTTGGWFGQVGVVTALIGRASFDPDNAVALICGPEIMMRFCARELEHRGVSPADIYVSMERNMACGVGHCGHCQFGPEFVCKDGPVFAYERVEPIMTLREV